MTATAVRRRRIVVPGTQRRGHRRRSQMKAVLSAAAGAAAGPLSGRPTPRRPGALVARDLLGTAVGDRVGADRPPGGRPHATSSTANRLIDPDVIVIGVDT